ncbi:cytochrome c biogenesis protein CcdA [Vibrio ostreicida]|uniref:Cytochrome c biogenesis protein CcdA n=1 Tax=Vibrio ostreicida TaxID=526588 RepID=A0ABT8BYR4_9VIBR|nr:cytochrome c biogenesis protein CcdA [Vibrio ostreicida]MDN3611829.1 cytochrome c biogenesis protein CcdA [Vibrio ostreicida]NPD09642.1 cytochrome C biogenesis protein [Vibrio ostreicida]
METLIQTMLVDGQPSLSLLVIIFAGGVLTSLTPCVYPMLPITVSVVASQAKSRLHGFRLSLLYTFGLALVYSLLGFLAASTGQLFGGVASHPATMTLVASLCLLMALWISGLINLPAFTMPVPVLLKSPWLNVLVAGAISGLVMAPCTSPVLGMMLMYVASANNPIWGAAMMFVFAFGMSTLLILAGTFTSFLTTMPRSGRWMIAVKWFIALTMLCVSAYFFYQVFTLLT